MTKLLGIEVKTWSWLWLLVQATINLNAKFSLWNLEKHIMGWNWIKSNESIYSLSFHIFNNGLGLSMTKKMQFFFHGLQEDLSDRRRLTLLMPDFSMPIVTTVL